MLRTGAADPGKAFGSLKIILRNKLATNCRPSPLRLCRPALLQSASDYTSNDPSAQSAPHSPERFPLQEQAHTLPCFADGGIWCSYQAMSFFSVRRMSARHIGTL